MMFGVIGLQVIGGGVAVMLNVADLLVCSETLALFLADKINVLSPVAAEADVMLNVRFTFAPGGRVSVNELGVIYHPAGNVVGAMPKVAFGQLLASLFCIVKE